MSMPRDFCLATTLATDSRNKRDGRFLEQIGRYDPLGDTKLDIDADKAKKWLAVGAQQSPSVRKLLKRAGIQLS